MKRPATCARLARRSQLAAALLAAPLFGCGETIYAGSDLLWSARHETQDLSEWTSDGLGASAVESPDGTFGVSQDFAHSGRFSAKLERTITMSGKGVGPRLVRFGGLPKHGFYSAWYLVPEQYQTSSFWTILQFDSQGSTSPVNDRGVDLGLRSLPGGGYLVVVLFHNGAYLEAPVADPPPLVSVGQWFHLEAEFQAAADTSGKLVVWLNGAPVYDLADRPTQDAASLEFMLSNMLTDATPTTVDLYVDDAAISLTRATPDEALVRE